MYHRERHGPSLEVLEKQDMKAEILSKRKHTQTPEGNQLWIAGV